MAFVEHEGAHLYYDVVGEGPAVLFLHGGGGNGSSWYQQIPHFARAYTCVVMDARGFGRSHPFDATAGDLELMPRDALAVLDAIGIERAALVCQSMGAWTGLRLALNAPERLWAFVGASSPMGVEYPPALENAMKFVASIMQQGLGIEEAALSERFKREAPEAFWLYRHLNLFNIGVIRGDELGVPSSTVMGNLFAPDRMISMDRLADVSVPTLLVSGGQDPLVQTASMRAMHERFSGAEFEVFEGSGHSPYFEEPAAFNAVVERFLDAHRPSA